MSTKRSIDLDYVFELDGGDDTSTAMELRAELDEIQMLTRYLDDLLNEGGAQDYDGLLAWVKSLKKRAKYMGSALKSHYGLKGTIEDLRD